MSAEQFGHRVTHPRPQRRTVAIVTVVVVVGMVIMIVVMPVVDGPALMFVRHPLPFKDGYSSELVV